MTKATKNPFGRHGLKLTQTEEIAAAIKEIHPRATTRVTNLVELVRVAKDLEAECDRIRLVSSKRPGAIAVFSTAGGTKYTKWSNAAIGSEVVLKRYPDGWRVMKIKSITVYGGTREKMTLNLTSEQWQAAREAVFVGVVPCNEDTRERLLAA